MANHYTDSIFYEIELTAKYCKLLGQQAFEKLNLGISLEEFEVLDTLVSNPEMCQRDLAKLILKDRANTGKLLDNLEKRGFIIRKLAMKKNRPVKIAQLSEAGAKMAKDVTQKFAPQYEIVKEKIENSDLAKVSDLLKQLRTFLKETIEIQI